MTEYWCQIADYPNYYVSTRGRVYSTKRKRLLKQAINSDGYLIVKLYNKKGHRLYRVHRLVAMAFIPNPEELETVNHINHDRTDNRISNLEWLSRIDNIRDGCCVPVKCIESDKQYDSMTQASQDNNVSISSISAVCAGHRKAVKGLHFIRI